MMLNSVMHLWWPAVILISESFTYYGNHFDYPGSFYYIESALQEEKRFDARR